MSSVQVQEQPSLGTEAFSLGQEEGVKQPEHKFCVYLFYSMGFYLFDMLPCHSRMPVAVSYLFKNTAVLFCLS